MPGVSTPRPVSSSEARYRTCSLSESARDCANDGISKVQAEKATRVAETRATTAAREGMSRGINFRMLFLGRTTLTINLRLADEPHYWKIGALGLAKAGENSLCHRDMVRLR